MIHPTAIIEPGAKLGPYVKVGPYCCVGAEVELGEGVTLISHVSIAGRTYIGDHTLVYPFASIGHPSQDKKYKGEPSILKIGRHNTIREYATLQPGTEGGGMITQVGDHCLFMVGSHVAHDCIVGNHVVMANNATLAGHVTIDDYVIIGGLAAVRQFVRVGKHAFIGGMAGVTGDVIPYGSVTEEKSYLTGLNVVGMKRHGFSQEEISHLLQAYRMLFKDETTFIERVESLDKALGKERVIKDIVDFIKHPNKYGFCLPKGLQQDLEQNG